MREYRKILFAALLAAAAAGPAWSADRDAALSAADPKTRELLLLMDVDRNGKVSKKEFMEFMAAEFDRLDVNKDAQLDVEELTGLRVRRSTSRRTGK